jgi:porin
VGRELSQTGVQGPSVFPVTAPAIRVRAEPTPDFYIQSAVFNGVAGDPNYTDGTHARVASEDGLLLITEAAFLRHGGEKGDENLGKLAFGTWSYTKPVDHLTDTTRQVVSSGSYALLDQALTDKISFFARAGVAADEAYEVSSNISAGLGFRELIPGRTDDVLGIAGTQAQAGSTYRQQQDTAGTPIESKETVLEVTYRAKLWRGVVLQPDYQYIDRPYFSKTIPWAQSFGARLELNF